MSKDINESKLIGGKRKNGHKLECTCHICENMKNKAKRGGYEEEVEKEQEKKMGGSKKKNGHRKDCTCPICKNMQNSKKKGGSKKMRKEVVEEKGETIEKKEMKPRDVEEVDEEVEIEENKLGGKKKRGNGHKPDCQCPICKNMRKKKGGAEMGDIEEGGIKGVISETKKLETKATDKDYDELDAAEKGQAGPNVVGGTRKRRGKPNKKGRKTRKARKHH